MRNHNSVPRHRPLSFFIGVAVATILVATIAMLISRMLDDIPQMKSQQVVLNQAPGTINSVLIEPGDWKEYRSNTAGYSIKYPPNWEPVEGYSENGGIVFRLKDPEESQQQLLIGVAVALIPDNWDLERVVEEKIAFVGGDVTAAGIQVNSMVLNGMEAVEFVGWEERFRGIDIVIVKDNIQYTLGTQPVEPEHPMFGKWAEPLSVVFYRMADSFQMYD